MSGVRLAELINEVASELLRAEELAEGRNQEPVFRFEECEIEVAISVEKEGKAGIRVWVLELGGGAKKTDANTVTVKFTRVGEHAYAVEDEDAEGPKLG
jgi:hypothetical protein